MTQWNVSFARICFTVAQLTEFESKWYLSTQIVLLVLSKNHHKASLSLGGGFTDFYFHSYLGEWSILTNISQMGWNHQLELLLTRMPKEKNPEPLNFPSQQVPPRADFTHLVVNPKQTGKTLDILLRTEGYNVPVIWAMKKKGPPGGCLGVYLVMKSYPVMWGLFHITAIGKIMVSTSLLAQEIWFLLVLGNV